MTASISCNEYPDKTHTIIGKSKDSRFKTASYPLTFWPYSCIIYTYESNDLYICKLGEIWLEYQLFRKKYPGIYLVSVAAFRKTTDLITSISTAPLSFQAANGAVIMVTALERSFQAQASAPTGDTSKSSKAKKAWFSVIP